MFCIWCRFYQKNNSRIDNSSMLANSPKPLLLFTVLLDTCLCPNKLIRWMILVRLWELDGYADVVYRLAFINVSDEVE